MQTAVNKYRTEETFPIKNLNLKFQDFNKQSNMYLDKLILSKPVEILAAEKGT